MMRSATERRFHDQQARARAAVFTQRPSAWIVDEAAYLDHESWIGPAVQFLGELHGTYLLDYGCGHGMASVVFARRSARVTACDLSIGYCREARERARANGVSLNVVQADGTRLPFCDRSFDRVWGNAVLHHLPLATAGRELWRMLRRGVLRSSASPGAKIPC